MDSPQANMVVIHGDKWHEDHWWAKSHYQSAIGTVKARHAKCHCDCHIGHSVHIEHSVNLQLGSFA